MTDKQKDLVQLYGDAISNAFTSYGDTAKLYKDDNGNHIVEYSWTESDDTLFNVHYKVDESVLEWLVKQTKHIKGSPPGNKTECLYISGAKENDAVIGGVVQAYWQAINTRTGKFLVCEYRRDGERHDGADGTPAIVHFNEKTGAVERLQRYQNGLPSDGPDGDPARQVFGPRTGLIVEAESRTDNGVKYFSNDELEALNRKKGLLPPTLLQRAWNAVFGGGTSNGNGLPQNRPSCTGPTPP